MRLKLVLVHEITQYQCICQRDEEAEEKKACAHGGTGREAHCCQRKQLEKGENPPPVSISRIALHLKICMTLTTMPGLCTITEYLTEVGRKRQNRHKICEFIYSMTCKLQSFIHSNRKIITTSPKDYTQISHRFILTLQKQLFAAKTFSSSPSRQASLPFGLSALSVMEKPHKNRATFFLGTTWNFFKI